jgi:hypothetical protein
MNSVEVYVTECSEATVDFKISHSYVEASSLLKYCIESNSKTDDTEKGGHIGGHFGGEFGFGKTSKDDPSAKGGSNLLKDGVGMILNTLTKSLRLDGKIEGKYVNSTKTYEVNDSNRGLVDAL